MSNIATKLTVILPVYNSNTEWLSSAIESVLNQTYKDFQLLIIDDGSNEKTIATINHFKNKDKRIRVARNPKNMGLIYSLNKGLSLASSEYIARMDSDDWCYPYRFEKQIQYLDNHPEISVLATQAISISSGKKIFNPKIISHEDIVSTLPFYCCIVHPSVIFRREQILSIAGYPNVVAAEDYALWAKICFKTKLRIEILPDICLKYRLGDNQAKYGNKQKISSQGIRDWIYREILLLKNSDDFSSETNFIEWTPQTLYDLCSNLRKRYNVNSKILALNAIRSEKNLLKNKYKKKEISLIQYILYKIKLRIKFARIHFKSTY